MRGITKPILKKKDLQDQDDDEKIAVVGEDNIEENLQPRKTVRFKEEDFISGYQEPSKDFNNETGSVLKPAIKSKADKAFKIRHLSKVNISLFLQNLTSIDLRYPNFSLKQHLVQLQL